MKTKQTLDVETLEPISVPNTMTSNFIQTLINNYRNNHLVSIKDKLGFDDAHSIHFDLPTLKKFISDIETETQKSNPTVTGEDLGIRFYYAAYPKTTDWEIMADTPIGVEYAQKHTLVMIPTMKMEDEEGEILPYDFNPLGSGNSGEVLAMASSRNVNDPAEQSLAQNHGTLIPPDSTKTELF
ncbi:MULTISPECIES: hypothetical protein [Chryseobacterium]|uniref:Uncharacterized protein n=1 Tax=Chryseobacterium geocarposphaerae TaxID=1416776 RepID=A0ABU1LIE9_9FLAO|nr:MULTISPECIES: hypothetical protein [Chryseobacterium]MDR6406487.1 hypothetical protein [Chryseobacterium geocarposphaerae]MDR6699923.1 hypothetical protein [Chryseobacterium ginsenosidimutans]